MIKCCWIKKHSKELVIYSGMIVLLILTSAMVLLCTFTSHYSQDHAFFFDGDNESMLSRLQPQLMPWQAVGGCGAGGSGGGAEGIKWIGEGVSGGFVEVEVLPRFNFGQNFNLLNIAPRISGKPIWHTTVGISLPFSSKIAEVQYRSNQPAHTRITGGMGDISCDVTRIFGSQGQFSWGVSMTFPTGQYDIKRGPEQYFLPNNLQMGTGLYLSSLSFSYSRDVEDGLWLFDASVSYPFMMRLFTGENEFIDSYFSAYKDQKSNDRFYYRFKPYGENDLGDYIPPSVGMGAYYAYRGIAKRVHSFGMTFSFPLGVTWIHSEKHTTYDPRPDPDHKAWEAALVYGLEFSRQDFPVFIGVAVPIHDKTAGAVEDEYNSDPMKVWNEPDWQDLFQQWIVAVGFKASLF